MKQLFILLFIGVLSFSCNAKRKKRNSPTSITGNYELLEQKTGYGFEPIDVKGTKITFDERKKTISANVGCNSIGGQLEVTSNSMKVTNLMQTEMYCEDPLNNIETNFVQNLQNITRYSFMKNGKLACYQQETLLLLFKRVN